MDFRETFLEGFDGTRLFLRGALPAIPIVANVIHVHGMGEHSARYFHVAEHFAKHGCRFCSYDMRGHGRSAGRRGYIERYSELIDDLAIVWNHYREDGLPLFLYGHSLGGQVAINFIAQRKPAACGAIIASPCSNWRSDRIGSRFFLQKSPRASGRRSRNTPGLTGHDSLAIRIFSRQCPIPISCIEECRRGCLPSFLVAR